MWRWLPPYASGVMGTAVARLTTRRTALRIVCREGGVDLHRQLERGILMDPARKLYRRRSDRKPAGVCGGLAEFINLDQR
jgi:hypothetical protein